MQVCCLYIFFLNLIQMTFHSVYAIEATCHAPTWEGVYTEIMRVLKPGGIVSFHPIHGTLFLFYL